MKFSVTKDSLLDALKLTSMICGANKTFEILKSCLIHAYKGIISITAVNLETVSIRIFFDSDEVEEEGSVLVDARHLKSVISDLKTESAILFETTDKSTSLNISTQHNKISIPKYDISEFPEIDFTPNGGETCFEVSALELKTALRSTMHTVSSDDSRVEFTCSLLRFSDKLSVTSTDGHRLSHYVFTNEISGNGSDENCDLLIPVPTQKLLLEILADSGNITFQVRNNIALIDYGNMMIRVTGVNGGFPDFSKVMPESFSYSCSAGKEDLLNAAILLKNFSPKSDVSRFEFGKSKLVLSAECDAKGSVTSSVNLASEGDSRVVGMNIVYLKESLQAIAEDQVQIKLVDSDSPVLIKGMDNENLKQIIMPMQI